MRCGHDAVLVQVCWPRRLVEALSNACLGLCPGWLRRVPGAVGLSSPPGLVQVCLSCLLLALLSPSCPGLIPCLATPLSLSPPPCPGMFSCDCECNCDAAFDDANVVCQPLRRATRLLSPLPKTPFCSTSTVFDSAAFCFQSVSFIEPNDIVKTERDQVDEGGLSFTGMERFGLGEEGRVDEGMNGMDMFNLA